MMRFLLILIMAALTGCASMAPTGSSTSPGIERSPEAKPESKAGTTAKPATNTSKRGGYYLDDGPGDNPPAEIDAIPDATPKVEPILARTSKPYTALGNNYTPMTEYQPYKASGVASWYGKRYHGQKTSSGEIYDMYGMTAAHTVLPIPSYVRVTNPENGRSVIVRVNDRGPFHSDRLIDLSYAASYKLRLSGKGSGLVVVELIDPRVPLEKPEESAVAAANPTVLEAPAPAPAPAAGVYLQVGAFKQKENADQLRQKIAAQPAIADVPVESWYNSDVYRVRLGPYMSREDAARAASEIKQSLGLSALIVP